MSSVADTEASAQSPPPAVPDTPERRAGRPVVATIARPLRWFGRRTDQGLQTLGRFFELGTQAFIYLVTDILRLRHPWRETLHQASFIVGVTAIPALLISVPFGVIIAVQVGNLIQQVGATSISGAVGGLGVIGQAAPTASRNSVGGPTSAKRRRRRRVRKGRPPLAERPLTPSRQSQTS